MGGCTSSQCTCIYRTPCRYEQADAKGVEMHSPLSQQRSQRICLWSLQGKGIGKGSIPRVNVAVPWQNQTAHVMEFFFRAKFNPRWLEKLWWKDYVGKFCRTGGLPLKDLANLEGKTHRHCGNPSRVGVMVPWKKHVLKFLVGSYRWNTRKLTWFTWKWCFFLGGGPLERNSWNLVMFKTCFGHDGRPYFVEQRDSIPKIADRNKSSQVS